MPAQHSREGITNGGDEMIDITDFQNAEICIDTWVGDLKEQGWCWYEDDKPRSHLWIVIRIQEAVLKA